ncbi:KilA-N domain-containing protein, partial [Escherichia coli]|uniref:KilA-N domain-containing protein n=1 Tax=Escherichia coli TaxID=562 RepID=UPI0011CB8639
PVLEYNGTLIREREEMLSLTDMWRAAGAEERNRPVFWERNQIGQEFISFVADNFKTEISQVWQTRRDRSGGTWAHWQIALAYAKYLSHEFHAYCNTVVREHLGRMREARLPLPAPAFKPVLGRA